MTMENTPNNLISIIRDDSDWAVRANCRGENPDIFFPESVTQQTLAAARVICNACVVRENCLETAITTEATRGIWGGIDEDTRKRIGKQYRAQPSPKAKRQVLKHAIKDALAIDARYNNRQKRNR